MSNLTDDLQLVTTEVHRVFEENKVALGLQDIWYGDQDKLPRMPCATIESGPKNREYNGVPRRTQVVMDVYVIIYHGRVADGQVNQKNAEQLAEKAENLLHQTEDLNGLVIDCLVVSNEPGYVVRGGAQTKASRLTLRCTSQKMLPYSA